MMAIWQTTKSILGGAAGVARGAFGVGRGMGKATWSVVKMARSTAKMAREAGRFAVSSSVWGVAAGGKSKTLLGNVARRAIGPGIILGGFGLVAAGKSLTGGGYSMEGSNVAWGRTPGMNTPYALAPMSFSADSRFAQDMGVDGSLAFAMHNQRKA